MGTLSAGARVLNSAMMGKLRQTGSGRACFFFGSLLSGRGSGP
jgi:hypothetical protein